MIILIKLLYLISVISL